MLTLVSSTNIILGTSNYLHFLFIIPAFNLSPAPIYACANTQVYRVQTEPEHVLAWELIVTADATQEGDVGNRKSHP